ncbi:hypothetical protein [Streptomyces bottropensis]|uniref:hypothetical protein n=1 Tax=Streptomyces bottropensis TaxID=42235 RepID=UPI0036B0363E
MNVILTVPTDNEAFARGRCGKSTPPHVALDREHAPTSAGGPERCSRTAPAPGEVMSPGAGLW